MRTLILIMFSLASCGCTSMLTGGSGGSAGQAIGADTRDATTVARDDQITAIIRNRFAGDGELAGLGVETRSGVVTLRGSLADFEQRDRALRLSEDVPGVVRVSNQITVRR